MRLAALAAAAAMLCHAAAGAATMCAADGGGLRATGGTAVFQGMPADGMLLAPSSATMGASGWRNVYSFPQFEGKTVLCRFRDGTEAVVAIPAATRECVQELQGMDCR